MKTVTIYTTMTCPFCYKAKGLLKKKGIDFKEISVDLNSKLRAEMAEKAGKTSVPRYGLMKNMLVVAMNCMPWTLQAP